MACERCGGTTSGHWAKGEKPCECHFGRDCEGCQRLALAVVTLAGDVSDLRRRLEEVAQGGREAPRVDTEAEKKAKDEAEERELQRKEAFLRARVERGKTEEVDDEDREYLSTAWMNG
jgi:nitrogen fixation/metabolism regulation signal transduction histidine kinase